MTAEENRKRVALDRCEPADPRGRGGWGRIKLNNSDDVRYAKAMRPGLKSAHHGPPAEFERGWHSSPALDIKATKGGSKRQKP